MEYITVKQPTYKNVRQMLKQLSEKYDFLELFDIGKSYLGRKIFGVSLGSAEDPVLFCAAFHGSEWLTCLVLLRFIENMCHAADTNDTIADIKICSALFGRKIVFIPCVNPDGTEIAQCGAVGALRNANRVLSLSRDLSCWQANARGVDLNHNFDADWEKLHQMEREQGIIGPAARQYGGIAPESEPETKSLANFCRRNNIRHAVALHSQGEVIYWRYGENMPKKSRTIAEIMSGSSGYALEDPEGLASCGGFKDWFIKEFNRPGFTVELGLGKNPLPMSMLDDIYNKVEEMLTFVSLI